MMDFWITKNVGMRYISYIMPRYLSGLHWKFAHDENGKQTVIFRFSKYFSLINSFENLLFWNVLVIFMVGWLAIGVFYLVILGKTAKVYYGLLVNGSILSQYAHFRKFPWCISL